MEYIVNRKEKMNRKKLFISIASSIIALAIIVICIICIAKPFGAKYDGEITVEVVDLDGDIIKSKGIGFNEGDTLVSLVEKNFDQVVFEDTGYGPFLKEIEGYKTPADWSSYIAIYVDDKYSEVGIGSIVFENGTIVSFRVETYNG